MNIFVVLLAALTYIFIEFRLFPVFQFAKLAKAFHCILLIDAIVMQIEEKLFHIVEIVLIEHANGIQLTQLFLTLEETKNVGLTGQYRRHYHQGCGRDPGFIFPEEGCSNAHKEQKAVHPSAPLPLAICVKLRLIEVC